MRAPKSTGTFHAFYLWTAGIKQVERLGQTGNPVVDSYQTINLDASC